MVGLLIEHGPGTVDIVVIGGGVAGLAAASALAHRDVVVLERSDYLGGRLRSLDRGQDWINLGAHLLTGGTSTIKGLADSCGLATRTIPGVKTALWFDGRLHKSRRVESYPFTLPLTLHERVDLVRVGARIRLLVARWSRVARRGESETATTHRRRLRAYRSNQTFSTLLDGCAPRVREIFATAARRSAGDADQITIGGAAALFGALWAGEGSASVVNVDGGSGRLGAAMEKKLDGRAILHAEVVSVAETEDGVEVRYRVDGSEQTLTAAGAIVATRAFEAAQILPALPADVAAQLESVAYGSFVCLGVLTEELPEQPWDDVYAIATPGMAFDMLFHHTNPYLVGGTPARRSLMCYVGGHRASALLELSETEIEQLLLAGLLKVLPQVDGAIAETAVSTWRAGNSLPTPSGRLDAVESWNERSGARVLLAGDYFAPLGGSMEAASTSGVTSAEMLDSRLCNAQNATNVARLTRTD